MVLRGGVAEQKPVLARSTHQFVAKLQPVRQKRDLGTFLFVLYDQLKRHSRELTEVVS